MCCADIQYWKKEGGINNRDVTQQAKTAILPQWLYGGVHGSLLPHCVLTTTSMAKLIWEATADPGLQSDTLITAAHSSALFRASGSVLCWRGREKRSTLLRHTRPLLLSLAHVERQILRRGTILTQRVWSNMATEALAPSHLTPASLLKERQSALPAFLSAACMCELLQAVFACLCV